MKKMNSEPSKAAPPTQEQIIERLRKEVRELSLVQDVLIAAGLVSKEKIEQAHEIVRTFK